MAPGRPPEDAGGSRGAPSRVGEKSGVPHGATETGWLPDFVHTGEKFEAGLAFFADPVGRIVRFSREPADLAAARRLEGQVALPGLVNAHSHSFARALRGRAELHPSDPPSGPIEALLARMNEEDVFDTARMVFLEMLLSGITCVGEFHHLHSRPDGSPYPESGWLAREIMRAAHDVGLRLALLNVACQRGGFAPDAGPAPARFRTAGIDGFVRETEALRATAGREFPADEVWIGSGVYSLETVPLDAVKVLATQARTQRYRFHLHVANRAGEVSACLQAHGRSPVVLLAEHGIVDKRFTAVGAVHVTDDEVKLLGAARAMVCVCPATDLGLSLGAAPVGRLMAAGAGVALGTDGNAQLDLLKDARLLEFQQRVAQQQPTVLGADAAKALLHAATVTGARSLGGTGGALEVGRPADFFTVNLYDPAIAGADADSLARAIVAAMDRRAIRDVWVGGRQRIAHGRHVAHGQIVGRFVDGQRRLWGGA